MKTLVPAQKTMRKKTLQCMAETLCQMFCGWRLIGSKPMLVALGSGTIEIDMLTGRCTFQNLPTPLLPIASELLTWTKQELISRAIPVSKIICARLAAKLSFAQVRWNLRTTEILWADDGDPGSTSMNQCTIDCESEIATDAIVYHSKLKEVQEWLPGARPSPGPTFSVPGDPKIDPRAYKVGR
jgi:hypothetical protein